MDIILNECVPSVSKSYSQSCDSRFATAHALSGHGGRKVRDRVGGETEVDDRTAVREAFMATMGGFSRFKFIHQAQKIIQARLQIFAREIENARQYRTLMAGSTHMSKAELTEFVLSVLSALAVG